MKSKPVELVVIINPYARSAPARVAMVYPHDSHPASSIPLDPAIAVQLLYWPVGSPFTLAVFALPKRLKADRSGIETETHTFVVVGRRAYRPGLDPINHLANWGWADARGMRRLRRSR